MPASAAGKRPADLAWAGSIEDAVGRASGRGADDVPISNKSIISLAFMREADWRISQMQRHSQLPVWHAPAVYLFLATLMYLMLWAAQVIMHHCLPLEVKSLMSAW